MFGQESESLSQKSGVIQFGLNTIQTTLVLEVELAKKNSSEHVVKANTAGNNGIAYECQKLLSKNDNYELRACIMYYIVIALE